MTLRIKQKRKNENELSKVEQFILKVIEENKKRSGFKGLNPVWSGLNTFLRQQGFEPTEIYQKMQEKNLIRIRPMRTKDNKSFVLLYLPQDFPENKNTSIFAKIWENLGE